MNDSRAAAHRRDLITAARNKVAKILAPDTTRVGANVLAEQVLDDLDEALTVDAELRRPRAARRS
jgi:hypothetical protein